MYVCTHAHACDIHTYMYTIPYLHNCTDLYTCRGTSNRRRKRVGHSRRQRRGRKAKVTTTDTNDDVVTTTDTNDDVVMNEDHVINQCPEATNTSNRGDGHTGNPPPALFTPAKEIINEGL